MPDVFPYTYRTDAAQKTPVGVAEGSAGKTESKGKNGVKRKLDDIKLDEPDAPGAMKNTFGSKKNEKRTKKTELKQSMYMNPFLPEPPLSVAGHEAHSRALTHIALSNDSSMDGQSFFS